MKMLVLLTLVAAVAADSQPRTSYGAAPAVRTVAAPLPLVRILESSSTSDDQGGYAFRFLSEDDIQRQEEAADGTVVGSYSYISPEGVPVSVRYVADTLGFRAESDALPTPVPTEYPTPEVPSTEAAPGVRTVQEGYSAPEQQVVRAQQPAVEYEPVYEYRPVSQ
ncbi:larval cuticle protein 16/17-like [Pollicipes pollicipes]|uniref:larval cuticle protein 16/17-like n=1 Tax=Pollicipes pollicipes TaxID=41117 RepID=UPI001884BB7C|nr:larval cuticle protein 16/17-like [Pollicipes pollicipes]